MNMQISFDLYPDAKKKAITMSYDDGAVHDRRLVEIFNSYGIRGTFHLNAANIGKSGRIAPDEVRELYAGHEISCHTYTHPFPNSLPREALINEIYLDRQRLEELSGYPVRGMSYPYGNYDDRVISQFKALGMEYSRTTRATERFELPKDFMEWHPTCKHTGALPLLEKFASPVGRLPDLALFYVWGHSFEFNNDNNWELIEEFCQKAGKLTDVWFATNIEIYDYINALHNLRFSVNCDTVYNPSAVTCFFTANGECVEVKPGETLKLFFRKLARKAVKIKRSRKC